MDRLTAFSPALPSGGSFAFETPNVDPIFTKTPQSPSLPVGATGTTKSDGTGTIGTDMYKLHTVGANGGKVDAISLIPVASAAATNTAATVFRIYKSTKSSGATLPADTQLIAEIAAPAQAADHSTAAVTPLVVALNRVFAAGTVILVSSHVNNAANTGWHATAFAGDF